MFSHNLQREIAGLEIVEEGKKEADAKKSGAASLYV